MGLGLKGLGLKGLGFKASGGDLVFRASCWGLGLRASGLGLGLMCQEPIGSRAKNYHNRMDATCSTPVAHPKQRNLLAVPYGKPQTDLSI